MPEWAQWVTFVAANVAAVGTCIGVVIVWWRGKVRLTIYGEIKHRKNKPPAFRVELVNPGRIAVSIKKVALTRRFPKKPALAYDLWDEDSRLGFPISLGEGKAFAFTVHPNALEKPVMLKYFTVMAKTQDGRVVKRRCPCLRQFYAQAKAARTVSAEK